MVTLKLDDTLGVLMPGLLAARRFEDAASIVLRSMLSVAESQLSRRGQGSPSESGYVAVPSGASGRLLRAAVHLRPETGYQRLFGIEYPSGAPMEGAGYLTSGNVWRWVLEHRCSVSIDVQLGRVLPWLRGASGINGSLSLQSQPESAIRSNSELPGEATRERMLERNATHVHVIPLRMPVDAVDGIFTLEMECRSALVDDMLWGPAVDTLEVIAAIAAPYLTALPARPAQVTKGDPLLPVVGRTTGPLVELLKIFAAQEETLLIAGPTGSGKSRIARWCHERSVRRTGPFETLELLSVPEELQLAELFGWKRGAFTGAVKDTLGAVARAAHGTLFLDEIDKLSLKAQAGLLRVLEDRRYRPIGDEAGERAADVRFIVGTNVDLRAAVRAGQFREDLYYRINVLPVRLPGLSERSDEIPAWASYMLERRHAESKLEFSASLTEDAVDALRSAPWPGNLRQLDNIVRRAYVLAQSDRGNGTLNLEGRHIEQALAYETPVDTSTLVAELWRTAQVFVREIDRRRESGNPLTLEACEALRGLVVGASVALWGRDEAYTRLGQPQLVKNRNHYRALRRELEKVQELLRILAAEPPAQLSHLLAALDTPEGFLHDR